MSSRGLGHEHKVLEDDRVRAGEQVVQLGVQPLTVGKGLGVALLDLVISVRVGVGIRVGWGDGWGQDWGEGWG